MSEHVNGMYNVPQEGNAATVKCQGLTKADAPCMVPSSMIRAPRSLEARYPSSL
jgi:hypothetical protein